ncbi:hypothetical protein XENOCAPTIV_008958 [Xenoophorus captivus]|uniref:C2H2-type domain-containing protein n=1 Tax=Xenoophorus captivus TaxID=1517983 RepID=A0ABV0QMA8_9TELE
MWEFLHSASQFLNINTYKHREREKGEGRGSLMGCLTEWPIVMVTAALHQSIQGTDGRCATGGVCFNEHTRTHTNLNSHEDTHTNRQSPTHTHAWLCPRSEGGY